MLVFALSDKGGTGRSVTGCNLAYRLALRGRDVCYLDFDFASPTAGAIFGLEQVSRGAEGGIGLHSYFYDRVGDPEFVPVWGRSDRPELRRRPIDAGRLVLAPGDEGGSDFPVSADIIDRCVKLFARMEEEYDVTFVDLAAGRSYASDLSLAATATPALSAAPVRWLVFHRWTRQHVIAASGLVYGGHGILDIGAERGHDREELENALRFVRTAVVDPYTDPLLSLSPSQAAWQLDCDHELQELAARSRVGRSMTLHSIPLDPVLQSREQIITDGDVFTARIANPATAEAFAELARRLADDKWWESL